MDWYSEEVLAYFLDEGKTYVDINETDIDGRTALVYSVISNNGRVKDLLNAGADPNIQDLDGNTALIHAIKNNKTEVVQLLVNGDSHAEKKAQSDIVDNFGRGPLYWACYLGDEDSFDTILEDLLGDIKGSTSNLAVHAAVATNRIDMFGKLIQREADVFKQHDRNNWPTLFTALVYKHYEVVNIYLDLMHGGIADGLSLHRPHSWNKQDKNKGLKVSEDGLRLIVEGNSPVFQPSYLQLPGIQANGHLNR
jgi:ankyrin repeat protein